MVKYRRVLGKLREQHASDDAPDSIPHWLDTLWDGPSLSENSPPPALPPCTSFTSSPPATPPHLRKQRLLSRTRRPLPRKPLQTSRGNQGPPPRSSLKRNMNNRDSDAEEQLPRELRDKAKLKKPAKYRHEEEQVLHGQNSLARGLGSPQKQQAKGGGGGATSRQARTQLPAGPRLVPHDINPGNPTTPGKGQGRGSSSPARRPQSPTRSSHVSDRTGWMAHLVPGVRFLSPSQCLHDRQVPPSARRFWFNYIRSDDNDCFIPKQFQEKILRQEMTPNRTKKRMPTGSFTDVKDGWYGNFYESELDCLFQEVCDVIEVAGKYRNTRCTEAHWMAVVVHPLLKVVRRLTKYKRDSGFQELEVIDMTSVNLNTRHAPKDPDNDDMPLNKRIDAALGLSLTSTEEDFLIAADYKDSVRSINPINGEFGRFNPFFAHLEVKLPHTDRAPGPQMGTWAAAVFSKREYEGYSLDMPIASISIIGDAWELWVAYPEGFGAEVPEDVDYGPCVLMGLIPIGNTTEIRGVFEILHYLCQCADWGLKEYREWFEREILRKYGWVPKEEKAKGKMKV